MWIFLPNGFYSIRAYDPEQGGRKVNEPHVVVRGRVKSDMEYLRTYSPDAFYLAPGTDYPYHLAVPMTEFVAMMAVEMVRAVQPGAEQMKGGERDDVHMAVWTATHGLEQLDEGSAMDGT